MLIKQMKTLTVGETTYQVVDSTVSDWAREPTKPTDFSAGGTMGGSLTINGDLTVNGISTTVETFNENINVEDNTITLRHNATTGLQNGDYTGIVAQKYDGTNNGMLVFDNNGTAYVGDEGDLQPLATRKLAAEDNGELVSWDAANQTLVKAPVKVENIVTKDNFDSLNTVLSTNTNNTAMSYVKDVPSDSANYAAVQKIGGMTRKCENLIPDNIESGALGINGGKLVSYTSGETCHIKGIPLKAGTYTVSGVDTIYFYVYDKNDVVDLTKTAAHGTPSPYTFTVDTDCYCGITDSREALVKHMLNEGDPKPYEPYFEGLRSAKVTEVKSVGVNLWGWGDVISTQYAYSMDRLLGIIEPNKQYTLTWKYSSNGTKDTQNQIIVYTENGSVGIVNGHPFTISEAQLSTVQGVYMYFGSDMTIGSMTGIMLNKGSTAQPYTPYVKHTLPIPTAAQALDGYGLGVNENCYNYIAWNPEDNIKTWNKRVGVVDLGTLDWRNGSFAGEFLSELKDDAVDMGYGGACLCSKYSARYSNDDKSVYTTKISSKTGCVVVDTDYTDAASFKAAMSGVMLVYELAEPIITDISDLIGDNSIGVQSNGTLTFENEYKLAAPSEVVFYNEKVEAIAADKIVGNLIGVSTRAISDEDGNSIANTYMKKSNALEVISGLTETQLQKLINLIDTIELE